MTVGAAAAALATFAAVALVSATAEAAPPPVRTTPPRDGITCLRKLPNRLADGDDRRYFLNRFIYCERERVIVNYYEVGANPPRKVGMVVSTMEIIAQGNPRTRSIRAFASVQPGTVTYKDWSLVDRITAPPENLPLTVMGVCVTTSVAACDIRGNAHTHPHVVRNGSRLWGSWDVVNQESSGVGRDKVSTGIWRITLTSTGGGFVTVEPAYSANTGYRCDSATYLNSASKQACIFNEVLPHWEISTTKQNGNTEIAKHIRTAQDTPDATYPLSAPPGTANPPAKKIPGKWTGSDASPALHRILADAPEYNKNQDHKDGACYHSGPVRSQYVLTGLPTRPVSGKQDCDEYPFRITKEGAASPDWDFSVQAVDRGQNRSAGSLLKTWMNNERILAWDDVLPEYNYTNDRFWVHVS